MVAPKCTGKSCQTCRWCTFRLLINPVTFCTLANCSIWGDNRHYNFCFFLCDIWHPFNLSICRKPNCIHHVAMHSFSNYMVLLRDHHLCHTRRLYRHERNTSKQSGIWESWTPIPSIHAGSLSNMRKARHRIRSCSDWAFLIFHRCIPDRRMKKHLQLIDSIRCIFLYKRCNIVFPDAIHILCRADFFIIQIQIGNRVNSIEM